MRSLVTSTETTGFTSICSQLYPLPLQVNHMPRGSITILCISSHMRCKHGAYHGTGTFVSTIGVVYFTLACSVAKQGATQALSTLQLVCEALPPVSPPPPCSIPHTVLSRCRLTQACWCHSSFAACFSSVPVFQSDHLYSYSRDWTSNSICRFLYNDPEHYLSIYSTLALRTGERLIRRWILTNGSGITTFT